MSRIDFGTIRARHRLADVARRSGLHLDTDTGDVMICCPMPDHADRTPSMNLHLDTDRYNCFGCGAHGDVIQWVRSLYHLNLPYAVALLDTPAPFPPLPPGVTIDHHPQRSGPRAERPDPDRTPASRVLAALADAWAYYTYRPLHAQAVRYLQDRGIDVGDLETETGRPLVGHTPNRAPDQLIQRLHAKGYTDDELVDAGLARRVPGRPLTDTYRHRLLVPVTDTAGHVIALIGRHDAQHASEVPKYLNPPRTAVYDKSVHLYQPTTHTLAADAQIVVCEGTLDALAVAAVAATAHQSTKYAPVAESGLAISDRQWDTIVAIHPRPPVLCADGDQSGQATNTKWAVTLAHRGRETFITTWPPGEDPASWLATHGPDGLTALTRRACHETTHDQPRPVHAAPTVADALLDQAAERRLTLPALVDHVLEPLHHLPAGPPADRYATAAAHTLAHAITANAGRRTGRAHEVIRTLVTYSHRLPPAARGVYTEQAALAIERADLAPAGWAHRTLHTAITNQHPPPDHQCAPARNPVGLRAS